MMSAYMDADHVLHFARVDFRNDDRVFGIKDEDRFLHVYIIGKTGTGKSTLIETMALQDWNAAMASPSLIRTATLSHVSLRVFRHRTGTR
jgi:ABC-type phosphate/phosphonate transport system ATPase subunit